MKHLKFQKDNACKWCDFSTCTRNALTRHKQICTEHPYKKKEKLHKCTKCGERFKILATLENHIKNQSANPWKCNWCDFTSCTKKSVDKHRPTCTQHPWRGTKRDKASDRPNDESTSKKRKLDLSPPSSPKKGKLIISIKKLDL